MLEPARDILLFFFIPAAQAGFVRVGDEYEFKPGSMVCEPVQHAATLVRWPTALRFSGQGTSKDDCTVADAGSMRSLTMELEFRSATGIVTITLPYLPVFNLRAPQMVNFKWEVPSHPAAGGDVLAGTLGGFFDEIPGDFPVFMGHMKHPVRSVLEDHLRV